MAYRLRKPIPVLYCSWSRYKIEEWEAVRDVFALESEPAMKLGRLFAVEFRKVPTEEPLLCNLEDMVRHKAKSAYRAVHVPCIVEHAGLILEGYEASFYPGGLTQPMWDALGAERFLACCVPLSTRAVARAVIGYCDGMNTTTFVGETRGALALEPKGDRAFYWDIVFCPDGYGGATYAEIVGSDKSGLLKKLEASQSVKALKKFMEYRLKNEPRLFLGL